MACFLTSILFSFQLILTLATLTTIDGIFSEQFTKIKATPPVDKMTHLHFYFHGIVSSKKPTAIKIIRPKNAFGTTVMVDDPLTESTEPGSKRVGRAQGIYNLASQHASGLLMVMNFAFLESKYNRSALGILGQNLVMNTVREMPMVGGSGLFRFACGYALAKTARYNPKNGDAVVEYDVFVMHD